MYRTETEDMLPRMAPKPSEAATMGVHEGTVRPQVPEVSILFGQPQSVAAVTKPQTYAEWKQLTRPKANYQQNGVMHNPVLEQKNIFNQESGGISNLYPLRQSTHIAPIPPISMPNQNFSNNNLLYQRRSLESTAPGLFQQQVPFQSNTKLSPPAKEHAIVQNNSKERDVLTICAGTQTDNCSTTNSLEGISNLATKSDVSGIWKVVQEIRQDQLRLMQMFEHYVILSSNNNNQIINSVKVPSMDRAIQVNINENHIGQSNNNGIENQQPPSVPTNKFLQHLKPAQSVHTPKGKPIAQSTVYRPKSPQPTNPLQEINSQNCLPFNNSKPPTPPSAIHQSSTSSMPYQSNNLLVNTQPAKSSSDKSMVMNDLALKYLPNEKLAELLHELNMQCPTTAKNADNNLPSTPLRNIENFEKSPSDISNASYKYLKKYRLLPEDHNHGSAGSAQIFNEKQSPVALLPFQQRNNITPVRQSPLARASPTRVEHMLDLENIRQQPKFL